MSRRAKFFLLVVVGLTGVGAAFVFRKPARLDSDSVTESRATTQREPTAPVDKPAPMSHLAGRVETAGSAAGTSQFDRSQSAPSPNGYSMLQPSSDALNAPSPVAALTEQPRHRIVDGDTLSGLAQRYLGRADRYPEIYELNRAVLPEPNLLPIGVELRIPAATPVAPTGEPDTRPMVPVAPRPTSMLPVGPQASFTAASGARAAGTYRVERHDTLSSIAKKLYGDARRYPDLLNANRAVLARPEDLREGMMLVVP